LPADLSLAFTVTIGVTQIRCVRRQIDDAVVEEIDENGIEEDIDFSAGESYGDDFEEDEFSGQIPRFGTVGSGSDGMSYGSDDGL
jgi:hypothetical protein